MKKILLVEDESHKQNELTSCLQLVFGSGACIQNVDSVHSAFWAVSTEDFDLIILDMALPTFSSDGSSAERGHDQVLGGVEVLRALKSRGVSSRVVIVTQYPEIAVDGKQLDLSKASHVLSRKYGQDIIGGLIYKYGSRSNVAKLTNLLKGLK